jgi:hypothetical protein
MWTKKTTHQNNAKPNKREKRNEDPNNKSVRKTKKEPRSTSRRELGKSLTYRFPDKFYKHQLPLWLAARK